MDLSLSDKHRALQDEVRAFVREHGHKSPKLGGGRKRPDQKTRDWQKLLVDHGYVGRSIPRAIRRLRCRAGCAGSRGHRR